MTFATGNRRFKADGTPAEFGGNVVPFARRAPAAGPGETEMLGATGS
ncbi:hypothetical protein [Methylobacterium platani]|nr:hypothetical protein [Methylobacterium platani]